MKNRAVRYSTAKQDYFHWLCDMVHIDTGSGTYWLLARTLHSIEFTWSIRNDDNRASDGIKLREAYKCTSLPSGKPRKTDDAPCSVFEMLIALAGHMDFELSNPVNDHDATASYFWEMIENLGLLPYSDDMFSEYDGSVNCPSIIFQFLAREYQSNGRGGLFPLWKSDIDQRGVEIWYQMNAYLNENYPTV